MNALKTGHIVSLGLAIFSMFFGAGNLMYPILVGMNSGKYTFFGMLGFTLTAVILPVSGLLAMILFNGNYQVFFSRLGLIPGKVLIFLCMMIIGPVIALPRIATLSHTMIAPFLPITLLQDSNNIYASFIFACIFFFITFLATFRENKIMNILGYVISPLLLISLSTIIIKAIMTAHLPMHTTSTPWSAFVQSSIVGYETLDLLGGIFFSSMVLQILKNTLGGTVLFDKKAIAIISIKAGIIGTALLGLVYVGMSIVGLFHGHGLNGINAGQLFSAISFKILGAHGAALIAVAVLMACLSTSIALSAICAEYIQKTLFHLRISYKTALIMLLIACLPLSTFGLGHVLALTGGPIIYIGYPIIIAITFCNIAYKVVGFTPIKIPVLIAFLIALTSYFIQ
jgi:LIVCS family branched-chain amino acid:cation transporter